MAYASNRGVRIHYEVEGEGPPLVLLHGLGGSLEQWHIGGHVELLGSDYQHILIDARGHGASDKPHDPQAYKTALWVADVVAVLDYLNISKAHYWGYSMGGWIGWGIAEYAPERFHSLIIGGFSPHWDAPQGPSFLDLFRQGMGAYLAALESMFGRRWTPAVRAICAANDLEALIAMHSVQQEDLEIRDLLPAIALPCLLYGGEGDPGYAGAEEYARRMPNATVVTLPGLDHVEAAYRTDLMLPHIRKFLAGVGEV